MRYAVLGGGGSFGIHTSKYLLEQEDTERVTGIGRNVLRPEPFSLNIGKGDSRYSYHACHIAYELDSLLELLDKERPQVIINYAAQGEGAVSWKHSWRFFEINATGLSRLTEELSKRAWLERFIHIGTSELYGSVDKPATEDSPVRPSSPYAASKLAFDFYLMSIHRFSGFPMNILRPSNAYCPGQLLHRIIPKAVVCGLTGRKLPLQGGGRAKKSYMHARDLARAIYLTAKKAPLGKIYNAGPAFPISIYALVDIIAGVLGISMAELCTITDDRIGQDSQYWLDSSRILNDLGWSPAITIHEGIKEMAAWGKQYIDQLQEWPMDYTLRA